LIKIFSDQLKIVCFNCKSNVHENKYNYYCLNKNCKLLIWKNSLKGVNIDTVDRKLAKEIFENGKTKKKIKLYSKLQNKYFDVFLFLDINKNKICFEY
jgi:NAD-dependent DNA ligase